MVLKKLKTPLFFTAVGLLYALFPTNNSTEDALGYAANIKYGEDLFSPHHLLYNWFQYQIVKLASGLYGQVDVLNLTKFVNTFFALCCFLVQFRIFEKLNIRRNENLLLLSITAFSFSFLRFGTENETYIIPIAFSLVSTYFYLKTLLKPSFLSIFLASIFGSIACLFHQIHVFWWLGLLIGYLIYLKSWKYALAYISASLVVPIVYLMVMIYGRGDVITLENFIHFVFFDFYRGSAKTEFGFINFVMLCISIARSFFQVHALILRLINANGLFIIPLFVCMFSAAFAAWLVVKNQWLSKREAMNDPFLKTSIFVIALQCLFALYAVGNVEFLVMIPVLVTFTLFYYFKFNLRLLVVLSCLLLTWNFSFWLFPSNKFRFFNDEVLVDYIVKHPGNMFLVANPLVHNHVYYKTGIDNNEKIAVLANVQSDQVFDDLLLQHKEIYTDIIGKPRVFSRHNMVFNPLNLPDFHQYKVEPVFFYYGLYGKSSVHRISLVQ